MTGYEDLPRLLALMSGDEKHDPAALSTLDAIWVLYDRVLEISPETVDDPLRDRFLLSKGHGPQAYFAVLSSKGYFGAETLSTFGGFDSRLGYHPDRLLVPGVEISSGSLGHGLAIAVGLALGLKATATPADRRRPRVFCLVGDAELDEGSNHEAIALAGRLGLERLTAIVIDNDSSSYGWPGGIEERFALEGWVAFRVDAHDHDGLAAAFGLSPEPGRPKVVVVEATDKPNTWRTIAPPTSSQRGGFDAQQP
jgi:transketolase